MKNLIFLQIAAVSAGGKSCNKNSVIANIKHIANPEKYKKNEHEGMTIISKYYKHLEKKKKGYTMYMNVSHRGTIEAECQKGDFVYECKLRCWKGTFGLVKKTITNGCDQNTDINIFDPRNGKITSLVEAWLTKWKKVLVKLKTQNKLPAVVDGKPFPVGPYFLSCKTHNDKSSWIVSPNARRKQVKPARRNQRACEESTESTKKITEYQNVKDVCHKKFEPKFESYGPTGKLYVYCKTESKKNYDYVYTTNGKKYSKHTTDTVCEPITAESTCKTNELTFDHDFRNNQGMYELPSNEEFDFHKPLKVQCKHNEQKHATLECTHGKILPNFECPEFAQDDCRALSDLNIDQDVIDHIDEDYGCVNTERLHGTLNKLTWKCKNPKQTGWYQNVYLYLDSGKNNLEECSEWP